jgi:hypothetical protein
MVADTSLNSKLILLEPELLAVVFVVVVGDVVLVDCVTAIIVEVASVVVELVVS